MSGQKVDDMKRFRITLGNTEHRPGHRHDCAQVSLVFLVEATSVEDALSQLRVLAEKPHEAGLPGSTLYWPNFVRATLHLSPEHLGARSVQVEEVTS